jgi:21S rRNA (GM2251-2'-O)-methyltransferase
MSVPHTTAASQFLYGYSTVYAALRADRRKSYTLYIHSRGTTRDEASSKLSKLRRDNQDEKDKYSVIKLARDQGVKVVGEKEVDVRLLDKMSDGRPHNVCSHTSR